MPMFLVAAVILAAVAAVYDVTKGEVPNWLTLGGLFVAPLAHAAYAATQHAGADVALAEGGYSVLGAVACAFVPFVLFRYNAIGGGDVKLFAAIGAFCQTMIGIEALTYAFIAAVLMAP